MLRDSQQSRIYRAESVALRPFRTRFKTFQEAAAYAHKVAKSKWWQKRFPAREVELTVLEITGSYAYGQGRSWKGKHRYTIQLPYWAWTDVTILHELAHAVYRATENNPAESAAPHGPEWLAVYLELLEQFLVARTRGNIKMGPAAKLALQEKLTAWKVHRPAKALALREAGLTYAHIARVLGYPRAQSARNAVQSALAAKKRQQEWNHS